MKNRTELDRLVEVGRGLLSLKSAKLVAVRQGRNVTAKFFTSFVPEIAVKLSGDDKQGATRISNNGPGDRGESFAHARFPVKNELIDERATSEIFELELFAVPRRRKR